MNKRPSENGTRAQKVPSNEMPTESTVPESVPGAEEMARRGGVDPNRDRSREEPRDQAQRTQNERESQPPLGGEHADNGSD